MKDHLLHLFYYTRWANRRVAEALEALGDEAIPPRAVRLLDHIARVQQVWLGRIRGAEQLPAIWGEDALPACRERAEAGVEDWLHFMSNCAPGDLDQTIHYENSKGKPFENKLREIAAHVVNHSTHHRGQIAMLIREAGGEPPTTDYIFYAR